MMTKVKSRDSKDDFKKKLRTGDVWSFKVSDLKEIIKCCRICHPGLLVSGNKGDLVERLKGIFQGSPAQQAPPPKAIKSPEKGKITENRASPYPIPSKVKQEAVERVIVKSGRVLSPEEARAFRQMQADLSLNGHHNPSTPIIKVVDVFAITGDSLVDFEIEPMDHAQVVNRGVRVHLVPLKPNLQPDFWVQPEMEVLINNSPVDALPKNWRKKPVRVVTFLTVLPLDITVFIPRSSPRTTVWLRFTNPTVRWHGLLAVVLAGSASTQQLVGDVMVRPLFVEAVAPPAEDDEVEVASHEVSLTCPISFTRIKLPAKGTQCNHRACFDLEVYIQMCNQQRTWNCPVCEAPCSFAMLRLDALMTRILKAVPADVTKVGLQPDNQWTIPGNTSAENPFASQGESLDDDSDENMSDAGHSANPQPIAHPPPPALCSSSSSSFLTSVSSSSPDNSHRLDAASSASRRAPAVPGSRITSFIGGFLARAPGGSLRPRALAVANPPPAPLGPGVVQRSGSAASDAILIDDDDD
eukprot:TRINITY_DN4313_c0_g1_i2.p1 TRINITY_DN4313_c0_g1~~TRINITY_DN4313_c0_g1_i2.p1  ORF type:complete len:546 (+),score=104.48 TRINITY_DN4313_c0_g1_i2:66-1640(+)